MCGKVQPTLVIFCDMLWKYFFSIFLLDGAFVGKGDRHEGGEVGRVRETSWAPLAMSR